MFTLESGSQFFRSQMVLLAPRVWKSFIVGMQRYCNSQGSKLNTQIYKLIFHTPFERCS